MNLRIARKIAVQLDPADDWRRRHGIRPYSRYSVAQEVRAKLLAARLHRRLIRCAWPQAQHWMCLGKDIFHGPPYTLWLADAEGAGLCHWGPWRRTKWEVAFDGGWTGFTETPGVRSGKDLLAKERV